MREIKHIFTANSLVDRAFIFKYLHLSVWHYMVWTLTTNVSKLVPKSQKAIGTLISFLAVWVWTPSYDSSLVVALM